MAKTETAVAVATPTTLTPQELTKLLQANGDLAQSTSQFRRMRLDSGVLVTLDGQGNTEDTYPPRVVKGQALPSLTVRIVDPPRYYMAHWLGAEVNERGESTRAFDPTRINRPDLMKSFSRKWDNPADQAADNNPANAAYEDVVSASGSRGSWKGDMKVQIAPEGGAFTGEEPVFTLTLSASSCLDWRGTSRNPVAGVVQETNFLVQLAMFAANIAAEAGGDEDAQRLAALQAQDALRLGGVVADVYILTAQNDDRSRSWPVIAFKPVHVEFPDPNRALPEPEAKSDDPAIDSENLPF